MGDIQDEWVVVWDLVTGSHIARLGIEGRINAVAISPDGKRIATASSDHTAQVWEVPALKQKGSTQTSGQEADDPVIDKHVNLVGHTSSVRSVTFSANGQFLLTSSDDSTARVWETSTGRPMATLRGHRGSVRSAAFSANGRFIITTGNDDTSRVWNAGTGQSLAELKDHQGDVTSARFSFDNKVMVTASKDETVRVWNLLTGLPLATVVTGHSAAISRDAKFAVTAIPDSVARFYNPRTGELVGEMRGPDMDIASAKFSPDGRLIVTWSSSKEGLSVWNATTRQLIRELPKQRGAVFSPDGKILTGGDEGGISVIPANS